VNHTRFPKEDHLPDSSVGTVKLKKNDQIKDESI